MRIEVVKLASLSVTYTAANSSFSIPHADRSGEAHQFSGWGAGVMLSFSIPHADRSGEAVRDEGRCDGFHEDAMASMRL